MRSDASIRYSLVVPFYNEQENIPQLYMKLTEVMDAIGEPYEMIFVDDGSSDCTPIILKSLVRDDPRYRYIGLSRNFGHQVAITAGMDAAAGEAIVGDIGFRGRTVFTALGDSVNVAARLQDMTKNLNCLLIMSEEVCKIAGLSADVLTRREIQIRGHDEPMTVRVVEDPTVLASLTEPEPADPLSEDGEDNRSCS